MLVKESCAVVDALTNLMETRPDWLASWIVVLVVACVALVAGLVWCAVIIRRIRQWNEQQAQELVSRDQTLRESEQAQALNHQQVSHLEQLIAQQKQALSERSEEHTSELQ